MFGFFKRLWDNNEKVIKRLSITVERINQLEADISKLTDEALKAKTAEFRDRLSNGESLDDLLPEAFAVVREASIRTLGQRHYDVQLIGGMVMHEGKIAEMKTGEGKTLAATLPAYLNALTGKGVHVVTVNDYLARRDAEWMGKIYRFLGLSVGVILHGLTSDERRIAYNSDITYGTNNEFGFDYLRDNMAYDTNDLVQRELNFCIIDEVDSILIDEARTPLIISGQAEESKELYSQFASLVPRLKPEEDYNVDEKARTVAITEEGVAKVERWLNIDNLYDESNIELTHHLNAALRAHALMKRDRDYVVKDGQVIIVDEFTGRLMFGRRYSQGLHQAIEAKEGVKVEKESKTLARITFQNYFRMYSKLAGMTGTALTEEEEFRKIYGLEVIVIPTNEPMIRIDYSDVVYKTGRAKFQAIVDEIIECNKVSRPVLVGTVSIEKSEMLSEMLRKRGVDHQVLNAKYHEREAEIIAQAGRAGAVTIATNMAGRGTDIILGGNPEYLVKRRMRAEGYSPELLARISEKDAPLTEELEEVREANLSLLNEVKAETDREKEEVLKVGGLHIIGTERHESRRIDNQLRGRSGRQGDPGSSRFYVALDDDLMRLFGGDFITGMMERFGWQEDQPIENIHISRAIENAQKKVEARNFDIRKQVLEYDDVMNRQREIIYGLRRGILEGKELSERIEEMIEKAVINAVDSIINEDTYDEEWDLAGLTEYIKANISPGINLDPESLKGLKRGEISDFIVTSVKEAIKNKEESIGRDNMQLLAKRIILRSIDSRWMEHLEIMEDVREGIGLRAYGQSDPLVEYKYEAFRLFKAMLDGINEESIQMLFKAQIVSGDIATRLRYQNIRTNRDQPSADPGSIQQRKVAKVGRNDPCPCGSGMKYKRCCGR